MADQVQPVSKTEVVVLAPPDAPPTVSLGGQIVNASVASAVITGAQINLTSLYIGDLDSSVTDSDLFELFKKFGNLVSVRVCHDVHSQRPRCYGYVNFGESESADNAMKELNYTFIKDKCIRIMYSNRDPDARRNDAGNIFIKNLDKSINTRKLYEKFITFGPVLSCKVATDMDGLSKGYGFVQYDDPESATKAIESMNGMVMNDRQLFVGPFIRREERENSVQKTRFNNVYVKNLSESSTNEDLVRIFSEYGTITSAVVMRDADGKSRCFGFVNFECPDAAAKAVESLNGKKFDDKEWYVGKAQKKAEREAELRSMYEQKAREAAKDKYEGTNLYIKNLDESVDDDELQELFSPFGNITSSKVMRDPNGLSKGSGFVAFKTSQEASQALSEMRGKMVGSKPLYVALAQRKEDRRARLEAQFSQMRPVVIQPPPLNPQMAMYPPNAGSPPLGPQLYYSQGLPNVIQSQPAFGFQHPQFTHQGLRPGGLPPYSNFFLQMSSPGQSDQRQSGWRRLAGQQTLPLLQQQMMQRSLFQFPEARGVIPADIQMHRQNLPYDVSRMSAGVRIPGDISALSSILASMPPENQRVILGESLYPLVAVIEPECAAKVTGMLLEMDQTEVLHLLESPEALRAKVAEALEVLKSVATKPQPLSTNSHAHLDDLLLDDD